MNKYLAMIHNQRESTITFNSYLAYSADEALRIAQLDNRGYDVTILGF